MAVSNTAIGVILLVTGAVSAGLATTDGHVTRLLTAVARLAADGAGPAYQQVDGRWQVTVLELI